MKKSISFSLIATAFLTLSPVVFAQVSDSSAIQSTIQQQTDCSFKLYQEFQKEEKVKPPFSFVGLAESGTKVTVYVDGKAYAIKGLVVDEPENAKGRINFGGRLKITEVVLPGDKKLWVYHNYESSVTVVTSYDGWLKYVPNPAEATAEEVTNEESLNQLRAYTTNLLGQVAPGLTNIYEPLVSQLNSPELKAAIAKNPEAKEMVLEKLDQLSKVLPSKATILNTLKTACTAGADNDEIKAAVSSALEKVNEVQDPMDFVK